MGKRDLKEVLVEEDVLSKVELQEAESNHQAEKLSLIDYLIVHEKCDEEKLAEVLCEYYSYDFFDLGEYKFDDGMRSFVSKDLAKKYLCLPIKIEDEMMWMAMANPVNIRAIDELQMSTGFRIRPLVSVGSKLKEYISQVYEKDISMEDMDEIEEEEIEIQNDGAPEGVSADTNLDELARMVEEESEYERSSSTAAMMDLAHQAPVVKLVNMIVIEGMRRRASDIFIEHWEDEVKVRARVDGLLEEIARPNKNYGDAIVSRIKIMSELNIAEHRIPQDGRFKVKFKDREADMRVSILPTVHGEKVCLRILDTSTQGHDISKLGFSAPEQQIIKDAAQRPHGMILVTGPTGSGKTTTLYSILKYLHSPGVNITTVEDPVEYQVYGINQVNVKEKVGMTFPAALRSILRQDPDIVLIGEIRDGETLDIAVKAAMTGHLVLSTLHTNDAVSSIVRMSNLGLEPFLIASTVIMISAQRLVRRLCQRCKYSYVLEPEIAERLRLDQSKELKFWKGKGCSQCRNSGYSGRSVVTEIFQMTATVLPLIIANASARAIKRQAIEDGMTTLRECALRKAKVGETSLEEVFRVTQDEESEMTDEEDAVEETNENDQSKDAA